MKKHIADEKNRDQLYSARRLLPTRSCITRRGRIINRHLGTAAFAVYPTAELFAPHESAYKRKAERIPYRC